VGGGGPVPSTPPSSALYFFVFMAGRSVPNPVS
jgi:hypothetical protein